MALNGAMWCRLLQFAECWFTVRWRKLVQFGATWCRLVQLGALLCRLVQFGEIWCRFVQLYHVIRIGQLSRDVIGHLSVTSKP